MVSNAKKDQKSNGAESGAALVTVIMITVLLGIACVALLSSVGANSKNSTDVLSETKAYYAAESGLQSTIRVLRNTSSLTYSAAIANPSLSNWITYNCTSSGTVSVGPNACSATGTSYQINVTDPDNTTAGLTFFTSGSFMPYTGGTLSANAKTIYIPNDTASPRTEVTFTDAASTAISFSGTPPNPSLGTFTINKVGGGVNINKIDFRIDYNLTAPRVATLTILGSINPATAANPIVVNFLTQEYKILGSRIELCGTTTSPGSGDFKCPDVSFSLTTASPVGTLYGDITPIEPFRLKVLSTGFGPNGSRKQLEAVILKDLFGGLSSSAATTMLGTNTTPPGGLSFLYDAGSSAGITYSGGDCASATGCVPSFGLTDPANLAYVLAHPPGPGAGNANQYTPPPALLSNNIPGWQQSPAEMDLLVDQLRTKAQNSGRYFVNPTGNQDNFGVGNNSNPPGSFATGTGITFCEGSCKIGASGGGILVVTGKLTNVGDFSFKGMIIVTGEEGWERNGGGNGQVIGNVIIAPYNRRNYIPENLSSTFLAPRYYITGGGGSDVVFADITSSTFDNTSSISDFMLGVAEK